VICYPVTFDCLCDVDLFSIFCLVYPSVFLRFIASFMLIGKLNCLFLMLMIVNRAQNLSSSGQPRRHLLQSGWSVFVSSKRLVAGDAFIFLRSAVFPAYPA
jgi:hypothetical protein